MVNFENGTLIKGAYVVINGVEYPVVMPAITGDTPMSAENLNKAQNDLYDEINLKAIVESGSNANGTYIKYGDGTMIVNKKITTTKTINGTWGNLYIANVGNIGDYPVEFIEPPQVAIFAYGSQSAIAMNGGTGTRLRPPPVDLVRGEILNTAVNYTIDVTAIGKWK